ncbi:PAQR family membrane homeostasis protein TrhA [Luteococcus sp. Sow4_B9]|uniref:PAQR family membrane homeostasis protein TrhA n=1 Tax=Luteococcus sp. Sow4_B9 TaxID=3438792 RepID=UPI003F9726E7
MRTAESSRGDHLRETVEDLVDRVKPRLRGWQHQVFAPIVLVAGLLLVAFAPQLDERLASVVYTLSAVLLFGNSAFYHRGTWSPGTLAVFRRVDHANIFVFIAGSYTPLAVGMLHGRSLRILLTMIWLCALAGVLFRVFWISAPRWLYVALYLAMGWAAVGWLGQFWQAGGPWVVFLIALGGLIYSVGAVVYGRKSPNPWPSTFGFHEIFHSCTVLAAVCHYIAICLVLFTR